MLPLNVVDLFCGAGGLSYGLKSAGLNIVAGIDSNEDCTFPFEANVGAKCIVKDVRTAMVEEIASLFPKKGLRVLAGCAPCQPFSSLSNRNKERKKDDKWPLLHEFSRIVEGTLPDMVTMENVPKLRGEAPFQEFLSTLDSCGYNVWYDVVKCEQYGVPQLRRRLVLLASRHGSIQLIPPTHNESAYPTVRDTIGALEPLEAGGSSAADPLHRCQGLMSINLKRIRASKPGGTWMDWPSSIIANCHRGRKGRSYTPVYGRMSWDEPSPTITTQFYNYGSGRFGHPEQDRPISLREGAMLQSFPETYNFMGMNLSPPNLTRIAKLIGNAVPVRLGEAIGLSMMEHVGIT